MIDNQIADFREKTGINLEIFDKISKVKMKILILTVLLLQQFEGMFQFITISKICKFRKASKNLNNFI